MTIIIFMILRENVKRNYVASLLSQTSAQWQVDKLTKEVTSLAL
jgi:hypothetical protein